MFNYSIMPLDTDRIDELCDDIEWQYKNNVADLVLFKMTLVAEGNPVIDKAGILAKKYLLFRDRLSEKGIKCGILVQSSLGHGYPLDELFPFTQYVNICDGKAETICCPLDKGVHEHFKGVMKTLAALHPEMIMIDDDFRLLCRTGKGCACELHMAEFKRLSGTDMTREEFYAHTLGDSEEDRYFTDLFVKTQGDSLKALAKSMREGIDEVDPSIQGAYCPGGDDVEFAEDLANIFAGKGNPSITRFSNGAYHPTSARKITYFFGRAAREAVLLRDKVDVILAETDTCPHNRYSTGAQFLHSDFTGNILEGATGAKHWITSHMFYETYEKRVGTAYRKILSENAGFYEELSKIAPKIEPVGCRIPLSKKRNYYFKKDDVYSIPDDFAWSTYVLERLGLPLYFSDKPGGATFLTGGGENNFTDSEIKEMFKGTLILASDALKNLNKRGFSRLAGVETKEWNGENITGEFISPDGTYCDKQKNACELIPLSDKVVADSFAYHLNRGTDKKLLFPACTVYENELSGTSVCFCGIPKTWYHYTEAFSFLCDVRKKQFIRLLKQTGNLPVYYDSDEEVYLRAGYLDKKLFCALFNLSYDTAGEIRLYAENDVKSVKRLTGDGKWEETDFSKDGEFITVKTELKPLNPVVLILS